MEGPSSLDTDGHDARALDDYLVASARLGDRRALALLFRRFDRRFRAHAWRLLGDSEAARDAVQEAWVGDRAPSAQAR